jgi:hypothetical protein
VVGQVATWIRETIQNVISTEYLRGQTTRLFRSGREEPKRKCKVRDVFEIEGYVWVVVSLDTYRISPVRLGHGYFGSAEPNSLFRPVLSRKSRGPSASARAQRRNEVVFCFMR